MTTLYRAGADAVLSYAGTGSATIWNHFRGDETLLVAQGLNMFRTPVPRELIGSTLADSHIYRRTSCNVVAIEHNGTISGNPDAHQPLPVTGELLLVGTDAAEEKFSEVFPRVDVHFDPWPPLRDAPSWCGVHSRSRDAHRNAVNYGDDPCGNSHDLPG